MKEGSMDEQAREGSANERSPELSPTKKWINRIIGAAGFLFLVFLIYKMVANKLG
jgi:hypothetical protein